MERAKSCRAAGVVILSLVLVLELGGISPSAGMADSDDGKTVVYRDEFGVPHVYAPTEEEGLYGMGWAQAEDRLEELLKNYLRALGEISSVSGPADFLSDLQAHIWQHYEVSKRDYDRIRPEVRRHITAFVRGINDYIAAHPSELPAWWRDRPVDEYMVVAHGRNFMWGWPVGQALSELNAAGITPSLASDFRSSNEMAIAPSRTTVKAPILIIDPHLSWWGIQRFWEFRIHAGALHGSGFTIPGTPYVGLGHTDHVAWAMTTGGPDTADIYRLTLNPDNPLQYRYENAWKTLTERKVTIQVKGEAKPRELSIYESHNGPVVARKGSEAYVAKLAYADEVQFAEAFYLFNIARNVAEFRKGLDLNQLMPQNVMVADTEGTIYYQRAGRVPVRPEGYDFTKPVDGSTARTEWQGIHKASDLMSIENPAQGYMQNCNVAPDVMMVGSPLTPDKTRNYFFNQAAGRIHQRGARAVQLLDSEKAVSPERAMEIALDVRCYQYERWIRALEEADTKFGQAYAGDSGYGEGFRELRAWDGYARAESRGALKFYYWRRVLRTLLGSDYNAVAAKLNDYMASVGRPRSEQASLSDKELKGLAEAVPAAMRMIRSDFGSAEVDYGTVFRVGRDDKSWPVGGGSLNEEGMATIRAIGFGRPLADHTRWGQSGQTSTQVVVLTKSVRSWTQPPIGQSDRADSPYYRDQAEKLFSPGKLKPTWYRKNELLQHVTSRVELKSRALRDKGRRGGVPNPAGGGSVYLWSPRADARVAAAGYLAELMAGSAGVR